MEPAILKGNLLKLPEKDCKTFKRHSNPDHGDGRGHPS